jgi:hypothetical protein
MLPQEEDMKRRRGEGEWRRRGRKDSVTQAAEIAFVEITAAIFLRNGVLEGRDMMPALLRRAGKY